MKTAWQYELAASKFTSYELRQIGIKTRAHCLQAPRVRTIYGMSSGQGKCKTEVGMVAALCCTRVRQGDMASQRSC